MKWWQICLVLCAFGFLKEFRPSEPFLSPYLNGQWKNFTEAQINQEIFPVGTYSSLALLVVVFLLTDWLKYKPVIILEGIAGIVTWSLLVSGQGIPTMQVVQFFYGLFYATEVAYYSYIYTKIDKRHYQRATSLTKTALLVGKASSGLISQILVMYNLMDYHELNYITLGALTLATVWACFLPPVKRSTYFHRTDSTKDFQEQEDQLETIESRKFRDHGDEEKDCANIDFLKKEVPKSNKINTFLIIFEDFKSAIKNEHIIKWSLWWALSMCGYLQVTYYMQLLWQGIINKDNNDEEIYHGFSNCAHSLIGAISTYLVGYLKLKWDLYGELVLAICSILQGCLLLYCARISYLMTGYFLYITYRVLYQASNTIALSEIAKHINAESYALIFGIDTFIALLGQSILTIVVIDFLKLDIQTQFVIYGSYYVAIGAGFTLAGLVTLIKFSRKSSLCNYDS